VALQRRDQLQARRHHQQRLAQESRRRRRVRWEDKASIGYYGAAPDADGIVRNLDRNRPIWDKSRYYIDLSAGYKSPPVYQTKCAPGFN